MTQYNEFFAKHRKDGKTAKEVGVLWRTAKGGSLPNDIRPPPLEIDADRLREEKQAERDKEMNKPKSKPKGKRKPKDPFG